jgi:hypothetical protein
MKSKTIVVLCLLFLMMVCTKLAAQDGKISGYMFGDYFYELSHPDAATDEQDRNGFQFRRIYFTYDRDLSERFAVRFRLEMNSPDFNSSDLGRTGALTPFVKHAYLSWKNLIPKSKLYFGLLATPTFSMTEEVWGYRAIEKTIMDLRQLAPSADLGASLQGSLDQSGVMNYNIMFGNGAGTRSESDQHKRVYVGAPLKFQNAYFLVPYFDYEGGDEGRSKNLIALFAGIQKPRFHGGVEIFQKTNNKALANDQDRTEFGASFFGAIQALEKVKLFGRFDIYDPNTDTDNDGNTLIIAGLDFAPEKNINLMPNLKVEGYQAEGADAIVVGALTLFYKF